MIPSLMQTYFDLVDKYWTPFQGFKVAPDLAVQEVEWLRFNLQCGADRVGNERLLSSIERFQIYVYLDGIIADMVVRGGQHSCWASKIKPPYLCE